MLANLSDLNYDKLYVWILNAAFKGENEVNLSIRIGYKISTFKFQLGRDTNAEALLSSIRQYYPNGFQIKLWDGSSVTLPVDVKMIQNKNNNLTSWSMESLADVTIKINTNYICAAFDRSARNFYTRIMRTQGNMIAQIKNQFRPADVNSYSCVDVSSDNWCIFYKMASVRIESKFYYSAYGLKSLDSYDMVLGFAYVIHDIYNEALKDKNFRFKNAEFKSAGFSYHQCILKAEDNPANPPRLVSSPGLKDW